jgi:hypothetical protein
MNEGWHESIDHGEPLIHDWRARQLARLGIPRALAEAVADHVDWHQIAALVRRGCPPRLALQIVMLVSPAQPVPSVSSRSSSCWALTWA